MIFEVTVCIDRRVLMLMSSEEAAEQKYAPDLDATVLKIIVESSDWIVAEAPFKQKTFISQQQNLYQHCFFFF